MEEQTSDWQWLDASAVLSAHELSRCCRLRPDELEELVAYGAIQHIDAQDRKDLFSGEWIGPLRTAATLRKDFDLDLFSMGMVLGYLRRIEALEKELEHLRAHLPGHSGLSHHEPGPWREGHGTAHRAGA